MSDLIRREDAVSAISDLLIIKLQGNALPTWNDVYQTINDVPSAEPERWIPVTEALPKEHERVLVTIKRSDGEKRVRSGNYSSEYFWIDNGDYWKHNDVLAWMPLVEPWEGE